MNSTCHRRKLNEQHREELAIGSGITGNSIDAAGFETINDPIRVGEILNNGKFDFAPHMPALHIPFFDAGGHRLDYGRIKLAKPRPNAGKYESPRRTPTRIYFPRHETLHRAIRERLPLCVTEGEKKSLRACDAGVPCIGLTGIWNWAVKMTDSQKRKALFRPVRQQLVEVCKDRVVIVVPDSDPLANAHVEQAFCEFSQSLSHLCNSKVAIASIPFVTFDVRSGLPNKVGLDDLGVAHGDASIKQLFDIAVERISQSGVRLNDYRDAMKASRAKLAPGKAYIDRSPTGSGKTVADITAALNHDTSLILTDSHQQGSEIEKRATELAIERELTKQDSGFISKYPGRGEKTGQWSEDADGKRTYEKKCLDLDRVELAQAFGLSASQSACLGCDWSKGWTRCQYMQELPAAETAPHAIATKQRARYTLDGLAEGKQLVAVQENAIDLLAAITKCATAEAFDQVSKIAGELDVRWRRDLVTAEREFIEYVGRRARRFADVIRSEQPINLMRELDYTVASHPKFQLSVYDLARRTEPTKDVAKAMRIVMSAVAGNLKSIVGMRYPNGRKFFIVAVWKTTLPRDAIVLLNDATDAGHLQRIIDKPIVDLTPNLKQERVHTVRQYPRDVTRSTSPKNVLGILRGIMERNRWAKRIGVITHKPHVKLAQGKSVKHNDDEFQLEERYLRRIEMVEHFGGEISRGSNMFVERNCDLLIVLGSPRPGPEAVVDRLLQLGESKAVLRDGVWMRRHTDDESGSGKHSRHTWLADTESGRVRAIRGREYADLLWRECHASLANAELRQAIGRARSNLQNGIPCQVASTIDAGVPVVDFKDDLNLIMKRHAVVLDAIDSGDGKMTFRRMGSEVGMTERTVKDVFSDLRKWGLVRNVGTNRNPTWEVT